MLVAENDSGKPLATSEHVGREFGGERERERERERGEGGVMGGVVSALGMTFG